MYLPMLFRFSLYEFLKNQRCFEPFLISFREICINLFEVSSGAIADLYGRRCSVVLSFSTYIVSFAVFGWIQSVLTLFMAMFFFATGEACRAGTHNAMIFGWLRLEGRGDEKTKIYGYTRSWSKLESVVFALIAGTLVFYTGNYSHIFWFSAIPYLLNIVRNEN